MFVAILIAAQLTLPASIIPPPGEANCDETFRFCIVRYADAARDVIEKQALQSLLEAQEDQLRFLRRELERERVRPKACAVLEVVPKKGKQ